MVFLLAEKSRKKRAKETMQQMEYSLLSFRYSISFMYIIYEYIQEFQLSFRCFHFDIFQSYFFSSFFFSFHWNSFALLLVELVSAFAFRGVGKTLLVFRKFIAFKRGMFFFLFSGRPLWLEFIRECMIVRLCSPGWAWASNGSRNNRSSSNSNTNTILKSVSLVIYMHYFLSIDFIAFASSLSFSASPFLWCRSIDAIVFRRRHYYLTMAMKILLRNRFWSNATYIGCNILLRIRPLSPSRRLVHANISLTQAGSGSFPCNGPEWK